MFAITTGRTAVTRLLAVAKYAPVKGVRLRALLLAIRLVKTVTLDYELYTNLLEDLGHYRSSSSETAGKVGPLPMTLDGIEVAEGLSDLGAEINGRSDEAWLSSTAQKVKKQDDKLEAEMRNYSVNLIKESIRVSCRDQAYLKMV